MRKRSLSVLGYVVGLFAVVATGCGGGETSSDGTVAAEPPSTQTTWPVAPSVTITARDYSFEVPPEIDGGVVRVTLQTTASSCTRPSSSRPATPPSTGSSRT